MKILWICNIMLPAIASALQLPCSNREGWLTGTYERLIRSITATGDDRALPAQTDRSAVVRGENMPLELGIVFPLPDQLVKKTGDQAVKAGQQATTIILNNGVKCYGIRENLNKPEQYDLDLEPQLKSILDDFQPDIVHIFGTEFPHARALVRVWERSSRILLGIQGICSEIARVYTDGLPERVVRRVTFRDLVRQDSLKQQQDKFYRRGDHEKEIIGQIKHISGRTGFDRECVHRLNPQAIYYHMNETLRDCFYTGRWSVKECQPGSIFLSQGDYPIKGAHVMLNAMPDILKQRPDAHLYVAGNNITSYHSLKDKIKISSYGKYLHDLIVQHNLTGKVTILGRLTAEEMKQQFLKSSVFVCPSLIENSPNALGEAMLLGVPCVAAATGGIPDILADGRVGRLFSSGNSAELAQAVVRIWNDDNIAQLSARAMARAAVIHNRDTNYNRLMELYHEINLHF